MEGHARIQRFMCALARPDRRHGLRPDHDGSRYQARPTANFWSKNAMTDTPSVRERLARAACFADGCCHSPADCDMWQFKIDAVDAILSELAEPSEGMLAVCKQASPDWPGMSADEIEAMWKTHIQHIRDGGS